jgi:hypothetical protein
MPKFHHEREIGCLVNGERDVFEGGHVEQCSTALGNPLFLNHECMFAAAVILEELQAMGTLNGYLEC